MTAAMNVTTAAATATTAAAPLIHGAVPVLVMPFDDDGAIDEDSLRREIDFCLEAGAQAICFGMASESSALTDAERVQVWSLAARHLDRRVPLIVATAHTSREGTIALTRLARECGADCAMVNPQPRTGEALVALFRDCSERIGLPLMIQDAGGNAPAPVLLQAAQEAAAVCSLKLESPGAPLKMAEVVAGLAQAGLLVAPAGPPAGGRQITVLGGASGAFLPEELERGATGTMPHPAIIDAFRLVCDRYAAGDPSGGYETYIRLILPVLRAAAIAGPSDGGGGLVWLHKELFRRAGVLRAAYCRLPASPLPAGVVEQVLRHLDGPAAGLLMARRLRGQ
jgi:2-keto-3-deoxy-L-arabinonate dehydratase